MDTLHRANVTAQRSVSDSRSDRQRQFINVCPRRSPYQSDAPIVPGPQKPTRSGGNDRHPQGRRHAALGDHEAAVKPGSAETGYTAFRLQGEQGRGASGESRSAG